MYDEIEFGINTTLIQAAAKLVIASYFDYDDCGSNLKAYDTNNKHGGHLSNIFGDRDFIHLEWEGPNKGGCEQTGEANIRVFSITNGKYEEEREKALKSLFNFGDFRFGFREVLSVNEDQTDACAKLFGEDRIRDLVHYVKTQKTNPSAQNRVFARKTPWSDNTARHEFVVVCQSMGYGW